MRQFYRAIVIFILFNNFRDNCLALNATQRLIEDAGTTASNSSNQVSEIQHATCQISTEDLVANAKSTVSRVLTGVCNADVVDERFRNLEMVIKRELDEIKQTLSTLAAGCGQKNDGPIFDPRQEEIDRLNNTVNTINTATGVKRTFVHFVRVENFDRKTYGWDSGRFERSPTIYLPLRSYAMYVKVVPKEIRGNMVYVNIGAGITRGIHDDVLGWPFPLKHQVEILDHSARGLRQDIISTLIDPLHSRFTEFWSKPGYGRFENADNPETVSLSVPASVILRESSIDGNGSTSYLWKGDLIVKLTVYL